MLMERKVPGMVVSRRMTMLTMFFTIIKDGKNNHYHYQPMWYMFFKMFRTEITSRESARSSLKAQVPNPYPEDSEVPI